MLTIYNKFRIGYLIISVLIGILLPALLYFIGGGLEPSFSAYYETEAKWWLFSFLLIIAGGFFLGNDTYKLSGILLIGVAVFDISFPIMHNILAISFFTYTAILMALDKRFWLLAIPIFGFAITIPFEGLYMFEFISLWCVALFNTLYILRFLRILKIK